MFTIIRLGKIKEASMQLAEQHYLNLLSKNQITTEVRTLKGSDDVKADTALFSAKFASEKYVFVLTERGKQYTSEQLSTVLKPALEFGENIHFLIAGPFGWAHDQLPSHFIPLSLSSLTLPHELAYVVLLEQLYRATKIFKNQKYHY